MLPGLSIAPLKKWQGAFDGRTTRTAACRLDCVSEFETAQGKGMNQALKMVAVGAAVIAIGSVTWLVMRADNASTWEAHVQNRASEATAIPTSTHFGPGYDRLGEVWALAIEAAIEDEFPIDCKSGEALNSSSDANAVCYQQGSFFCKAQENDVSISTAAAIFTYDKGEYGCKIALPAHAISDSTMRVAGSLENCSYYNGPAGVASAFAEYCERGGDAGVYCSQGKLTDLMTAGTLKFDWTGYVSGTNRRSDIKRARDFAYITIPVSHRDARGTACSDLPLVDVANIKKVLATRNLDEFVALCDGGVSVCGAFTGEASGHQRCAIRTAEEVRNAELYWFDGKASLGSGMIVNYMTNFPGASGSTHSCLRTDGSPIPFAISVGMRRYYRADDSRTRPDGDGAVEYDTLSDNQDVRNSDSTKRNFLLKGDRYRDGDPDGGDFEIAAPIRF